MATIFSTLLSAFFNWAPLLGHVQRRGNLEPGGEYSLYGLYGDVPLQGTVFYLSLWGRGCNFVTLSEGYYLYD